MSKMLIKLLPRHSAAAFRNLTNYILNHEKSVDYPPVLITHNLRGKNDKESWIKQFYENEALYRKTKHSRSIYCYHEILSVAAADRKSVTPEMLRDLGQKYIELRGKDALYLGFAHFDRDHVHIHFQVSGLKYRQSKAHRLSREALQTLKIDFQNYHREKYPQLDKSICEHGKGKEYLTDREYQYKARTKRTLLKEDIAKTVRECFEKASTQNEFIEMLMHHELPSYERKGIATGVVHGNLKFRFSRLGIEQHELEKLPVDLSPEQQALDEIRAIRGGSYNLDRELER
ncbi:MAG: relaxase/mobilization nuclease domain-containing protein [Bacteroidetes bacterium]|nr:MAG: relaxase/mobilization nuclease domain-containing protein [Bacteroidota bacterium]